MRIGEVIGNVTLSRVHPSLVGARLLIAVPLSLEFLQAGSGTPLTPPSPTEGEGGVRGTRGEPVVVYDELGAGNGSRIGFSEGREASQPFRPERWPVDAYCACILDAVEVMSHES